jgi:hypothetical protein
MTRPLGDALSGVAKRLVRSSRAVSSRPGVGGRTRSEGQSRSVLAAARVPESAGPGGFCAYASSFHGLVKVVAANAPDLADLVGLEFAAPDPVADGLLAQSGAPSGGVKLRPSRAGHSMAVGAPRAHRSLPPAKAAAPSRQM